MSEKSAASHGWLAAKKGLAHFGVQLTWLLFPAHEQRKGSTGLSVLTKSPLSKWKALKKPSLTEASSLHQAKLGKKPNPNPIHIFSVSITADSMKYPIILSST